MFSRRGPLSRGGLRRLILAFAEGNFNNGFGPLEGVPPLWGPKVAILHKTMTLVLLGPGSRRKSSFGALDRQTDRQTDRQQKQWHFLGLPGTSEIPLPGTSWHFGGRVYSHFGSGFMNCSPPEPLIRESV